MVDRVTRYREREPLLEVYGVDQEIRSTLNRRVDLPSGGYLIFDYAEAFTVIDVNTGRFVGSRSKNSGPGRLEETITKNNLEERSRRSCASCACGRCRRHHRHRLHRHGGIRRTASRSRTRCASLSFERDRTKTYVVEISPLGLEEMTAPETSPTGLPREVMTPRQCPTCGGDGIVVSDGTAANEGRAPSAPAWSCPGSRCRGVQGRASTRRSLRCWLGRAPRACGELEEVTRRRFFFVGIPDVHLDHLRVLEQGTVEKLAPSGPVEVGQEIELRLGEVGLYDAHAGVGKLEGVDVIVTDASKLVG